MLTLAVLCKVFSHHFVFPWISSGELPVIFFRADIKRILLKMNYIFLDSQDISQQCVLGSDTFLDWVKREDLPDRKEEPSLVHLQESFSFEELAFVVSEIYGVSPDEILKRKSRHREGRRILMYCACYYCRHKAPLSQLSKKFSVSVSRPNDSTRPSLQFTCDWKTLERYFIDKIDQKLSRQTICW